jgi:hypothetical protein
VKRIAVGTRRHVSEQATGYRRTGQPTATAFRQAISLAATTSRQMAVGLPAWFTHVGAFPQRAPTEPPARPGEQLTMLATFCRSRRSQPVSPASSPTEPVPAPPSTGYRPPVPPPAWPWPWYPPLVLAQELVRALQAQAGEWAGRHQRGRARHGRRGRGAALCGRPRELHPLGAPLKMWRRLGDGSDTPSGISETEAMVLQG